ncbi:DUF2231 domain-containing protein [Actinopolymorpha pittospori]|uniref:Membrane protein n=1 Tax=Actinopolymorpha pittospori TaxID=648752 RepID=A0A927N9Y5_9ACTN|nr:DUF2231 domain-containing protein [Actinopolymorpha pittospori]MBE1611667.1 putative membrane protein [Actinopolymorpha pittospori]
MFDQVSGLPVHVLVIHVVVVFVPLTVLVALGYALVPRWRWLLRWPLVVGSVASWLAAVVAQRSGYHLITRLGGGTPAAQAHEGQGQLLGWVLLGFFVVSVAAAFAVQGPGAPSWRGEVGRRSAVSVARPIQIVVVVLLIVAAVAAGVQVFRTGDSGARAVWGSAS